jgi:hypothetical protein
MDNAQAIFDYKPFLKEAYINPIRTVTVIDDEYPTLESLIIKSKDEFNQKDVSRLTDIIEVSRKTEFNWMLDVHDGEDKGSIVAQRLHHSDLLILDYHLDGEDDGVCEQSINILKHLADNSHFNLVAVHTKGYTGPGGTVRDVFRDIVVAMQERPNIGNLNAKILANLNEGLDEWGFEIDEIRKKLLNSISDLDLLYLCKNHGTGLATGKIKSPYLNEFYSLYDEKPDEAKVPLPILLKWLCIQKFEFISDLFGTKTYNYFNWGIEDNVNWLKADDLFLTVIGKKDTPVAQIPEQLIDALVKWAPHPHKLILAKFRHEIERNGVSASQNILNKEYLQAAWLNDLIESSDQYSIGTNTWNTTIKLWEELAYQIKHEVSDFAIKLTTSLQRANSKENPILELFVDNQVLSEKELQLVHANCFSCSKGIDTHHISTGHILEIDNKYWLCMTPSCDLVPGQKESVSEYLPITLVQLYDAKQAWNQTRKSMLEFLNVDKKQLPKLSTTEELQQILKYATANNLIFVKLKPGDDTISYLSFTVGIDGKANPKAKDFLVTNKGVFDPKTRSLSLFLTDICTEEAVPKIYQKTATVVAELRYEYALNLLSRLGIAKSRIGLGFAGT